MEFSCVSSGRANDLLQASFGVLRCFVMAMAVINYRRHAIHLFKTDLANGVNRVRLY
jgi:hypothetical protein